MCLVRSMVFSRGEGRLGTIYERLRKASYRRTLASNAHWGRLNDLNIVDDAGENAYSAAWHDAASTDWQPCDHEVYLRGVCDTLHAIQDDNYYD